jgi:hypothetical protein
VSGPLDPRAGAWQTASARAGGWASIRWERRRPGLLWVVVSHDQPSPAGGPARGDLRVHYAATDEAAAREKFAALKPAR